MAIKYPPNIGQLLICDFSGAIEPEICKKRPVVVLSCVSYRLCIVVPLSTTPPKPPRPWHYLLYIQDPLPAPYDSPTCWAKCDMVCAISYDRLQIPFNGRDKNNKRIYVKTKIPDNDLSEVKKGVSLAISHRD